MTVADKIQRRVLLVAERTVTIGRYRCSRIDGVLRAAKGAGYITITTLSAREQFRNLTRKTQRFGFEDKKYIISLTDSGWEEAKKWNTISMLGGLRDEEA